MQLESDVACSRERTATRKKQKRRKSQKKTDRCQKRYLPVEHGGRGPRWMALLLLLLLFVEMDETCYFESLPVCLTTVFD